MVVLFCSANAPWKNSSVAISPADCVQIAVQHQIFAKEQVLVYELLYQISVNIFGMSVFEMKVEHKISICWLGDEPDQPATVPHVLCVHSLGQVICLDIAHNPPPPTPPTHPLHPSHTRGWVVNWWWWMWWWWCVCYVIKAPPNPTTPFTCNCLDITMCNVPSNPTTICSPPLYPAPLLSWVSYLTLPARNDKVSYDTGARTIVFSYTLIRRIACKATYIIIICIVQRWSKLATICPLWIVTVCLNTSGETLL